MSLGFVEIKAAPESRKPTQIQVRRLTNIKFAVNKAPSLSLLSVVGQLEFQGKAMFFMNQQFMT